MSLPTTHWTVLAKLSDPQERGSALAQLCSEYWRPVYAFLRRCGVYHEEAEDLTQGFFELVVREGIFERANPQAGRLRSFLLGALDNFMANVDRTRSAQKRGGGIPTLSLEEPGLQEELERLASTQFTPEQVFDRAWLEMLLQRVVEELREQYQAAGKSELFSALLPWLLGGESASQAEAARRAGTTVANFRVQLHRLRARYREALQREIESTLQDHTDFAAELEYLFSIARGN